jgi:hypothetical protein
MVSRLNAPVGAEGAPLNWRSTEVDDSGPFAIARSAALDPPRVCTGPPWPESADPFPPCPYANPRPASKPTTSRRSTTKAASDTSPQLSASKKGQAVPAARTR